LEPVKLVLRFTDGRVVKGVSRDFYPDKGRCHVVRPGDPSNLETEVLLTDLKAVFIVKDFRGDPGFREQKDFSNGAKTYGQKVEVTFMDGEVLVGSTLGPGGGIKRRGFFLFPADARSNVLRAFVFSSAVRNVRPLQETEVSPRSHVPDAGIRKVIFKTPSPPHSRSFSPADAADRN
jgi:hypothetical protein